MKNEYMRPARELSLPVVAGTKSGDPVRVGAFRGVAATNRAEANAPAGGNPVGNASVVCDNRAYTYEVEGAITGPGTPVYLVPRNGATAPRLTVAAQTAPNDVPWGYTIPKVGESGQRTATAGVAVVTPHQV